MATRRTQTRIRRAITRYSQAAKTHAFRGTFHPDDWAEIDEAFDEAGKTLERIIFEEIGDGLDG